MNERVKDKFSIVIPVYNEEPTVAQVLSEIIEHYGDSEIIVVDDGSTDGTRDKLEKFDMKIITHKENKGYGAALKTGIKKASNDIIVTIDADGEHSIKDINLLFSNGASFPMVVGKRTNHIKDKLWKTIGKKMLKHISNLALGL
ncbi:unnamed protein product, partial [marine sediment metagenome]